MHSNMRNFTAPYVFHEFPKCITLADGSSAIANNADEEAVLTAKDEDAADRDALMAEAKALRLNPHPRHGVEKLKQLISEAQSKESQS